jgi:hypothetical protein
MEISSIRCPRELLKAAQQVLAPISGQHANTC